MTAKNLAETTEQPAAEAEVQPDAEAVKAAMDQAAAEKKSAQSAARKAAAAAKAAAKPAPKPAAKAKPAKAAKPKTEVARVPAETFVAEVKRLKLTNTQAAKALGVSPSSISEYVGHGRGRLMAQDRWADAKKALAAFAKEGLK